MKHRCEGVDAQGRPVVEVVEATNATEAMEAARRRGIFVTRVMRAASESEGGEGRGAGVGGGGGGLFRGVARLRRVADFSRQLAVLVGTGTPVAEALASLQRQASDPRWRGVLGDVLRRVEEGEPLSRAMECHPGWFDAVCRSLVSAGESGGRMEQVLTRLHELTRQQLRIASTVRGAMVYPLLLITLSLGVLGGMVGFVLPRFEGLFETLDAPLPPTTKVVMAIGDFLRGWWFAVLGGVAAVVVGLVMLARTPEGRAAIDRAMVTLPLVGPVVRGLLTARIARVLGVLLDGRVTMLEALTLTRAAAGNLAYVAALGRVHESVTRGESASAAFEATGLVPATLCEAMRSGERGGQLARVLLSVADSADEDNEVLVRTLTGVMEPIILAGLGLVVGVVAIGIFLPLFDLTAAGAPGGPGAGGGAP